jgi:serine protease
VVVAAAGNDTASICGTPGFDDGALCVAATDRNEVRSWYGYGIVDAEAAVSAAAS